jgi:hypothetical protein
VFLKDPSADLAADAGAVGPFESAGISSLMRVSCAARVCRPHVSSIDAQPAWSRETLHCSMRRRQIFEGSDSQLSSCRKALRELAVL